MAEEPTTPVANQGEPPAGGQEPVIPATKPTQPDPAGGGDPPKPASNQDWSFQRQAEKARKEADEAAKERDDLAQQLKTKEDAELSEAERRDKNAKEADDRAAAAEHENARLQAIMEAELPKELAELVPEGIENPKEYIEKKVLPLKEKLTTPAQFGNQTQPGRQTIPDEEQLILDKFKGITDPDERQKYYNKHHGVLAKALSVPLPPTQ